MNPLLSNFILLLSAAGYPMCQFAIRRYGRTGAIVVQLVCTILLVRDIFLVGNGTPGILRRLPAALLYLECLIAALAALSNSRIIFDQVLVLRATGHAATNLERLRRAGISGLFVLHTVRFWIYLQPDQGRR